MKLTAFVEPGATNLFVPFSDLTSGTETYAAGRFMDLTPNATRCTSWTSTARTSRTATTISPTSVRTLPLKTA